MSALRAHLSHAVLEELTVFLRCNVFMLVLILGCVTGTKRTLDWVVLVLIFSISVRTEI